MDLELTGKSVLISGGTKGIGLAIARQFLQEGAKVSICARHEEDVLRVVKELSTLGQIHGLPLDVCNHADLASWVSKASSLYGGIDIVVANVSAQSREWQPSFDTDILATSKFIELSVPHLKQSQAGSIIAIASQAANLAVPNYKPYPAMKAALISYMGSLAKELGPTGIRVNTVSPGEILFEGSIWDQIKKKRPEKYQATLAKKPLGRFGTPEEVAKAVVFLSSPAASYISGANLLVDGAGRDFIDL